jgi:hypothetical protein
MYEGREILGEYWSPEKIQLFKSSWDLMLWGTGGKVSDFVGQNGREAAKELGLPPFNESSEKEGKNE